MQSETPATETRARASLRDDLAYVLPMAVFLLLTQVGVWWRSLYPVTYVVKTILVAVLLIGLRRYYTRIRWSYWWLGAAVGVIGIFQWVGMQRWLQGHIPFFAPSGDVFDPTRSFSSTVTMWSFIVLRLAGATLLVPFMEELFWRDYLWRQVLAPNDFKLAAVGEWGWAPFLIVSGVFAVVHGNWWLTSIVWAMMIGGLLAWTRSLGACIVAHAVTNLLLGLYVLRWHDWAFW
jgi:CAAX prenyl protease-like protein